MPKMSYEDALVLAQDSVSTAPADHELTGGIPATFAGHRTGKRRRGVSVLKRKPRSATHAVLFDMFEDDGRIIALGVKMISGPSRLLP